MAQSAKRPENTAYERAGWSEQFQTCLTGWRSVGDRPSGERRCPIGVSEVFGDQVGQRLYGRCGGEQSGVSVGNLAS